MTRILKNSWFNRFARKEKLSDLALTRAVAEADAGRIDADLAVV